MTKPIMYSTMAVLGSVAIGSVTAFGIYFNKNKINQTALAGVNEKQKFVAITIHPDNDVTHQVSKIYDIADGEKTLGDVIAHHASDFTFSQTKSMGILVSGIFGQIASGGKFWALTSHSYVLHHPEAAADSSMFPRANSLSTGVSGVSLNFSEYFDFYLT